MQFLDIVLTSGVTTIILTAIMPFVGKKWINNYFKKKLEDHKHDLQLLSKKVDFDYQRQIHDFSLFTTKKHEIYAELFSKFAEANTEIGSATASYRNYPNFRKYKENEVREYLTEVGASENRFQI